MSNNERASEGKGSGERADTKSVVAVTAIVVLLLLLLLLPLFPWRISMATHEPNTGVKILRAVAVGGAVIDKSEEERGADGGGGYNKGKPTERCF